MELNRLQKIFNEKHGSSEETTLTYFAPGRVNLIGEHTDYNGGYVFPCALSFGTYMLVRKNSDQVIRFASTNFDYSSSVKLSELEHKHDGEWINYPLGVINELKKKGYEVAGMDILYHGNIPNGAGLSSSASIELVTAYAINDLYALNINRTELALIGQKAENEFVGMNCGIMDQFAVAMGKSNTAIFLNCDTLEYSLVPVKIDGYKIVITNTNKGRKLTDSKYNERRGECQSALDAINEGENSFKNLSEISVGQFTELQKLIRDETVRNRARHVITENNRVLKAIKALNSNNLSQFGELMYASHESLRYDYEVTCLELDTLVEEAQKCEGVIGSRMTGAGFGGCTVSIVAEDKVDEFQQKVGKNYEIKTGLKADFYIAEIGNGVQMLH
ncbi:MAG: galactokinase [Bacteroidales bacterium]|nr:galactokinase [Bacteroidales bacterium]